MKRLQDNATYARLFDEAFGTDVPDVTLIAQALASYERTLIGGTSRYDNYFYGDGTEQFSDDERAGLSLFFSERGECYHCHGGALFSMAFIASNSTTVQPAFENNGYGNGDDLGLMKITLKEQDQKKFRVPTLRNIGVTAPYMHDGGLATLRDVVEHYNKGGDQLDGQSQLVRPMNLTSDEKRQLVAFLLTLTER
jgi:cytochrome c peroxidase